MPRARLLSAAILFLAATLAVAQDPTANPFHWKGTLAAGKVLTVKGIAGSIDASGATGDEVEITADKHGDAADRIRIEVVQDDSGLTVCAIYPQDLVGHAHTCEPGGEWNVNSHGSLPRVDFTVRLPRKVRLVARDINGKVHAKDLGAPADLRTVNGSLGVQTTEWAHLVTVNGNIDASFGSADWKDSLTIETVNGNIDLQVPADLSADFDYKNVNGHLDTDFPMTISGSISPRHISARLGGGGRELKVRTVNGNLTLHKLGSM